MAQAARVVEETVSSITARWEPCHVDDLTCLLNPLRAFDLKQILLLTPPELRVEMAVVFTRIRRNDLPILLDLAPRDSKRGGAATVNIWRYLTKANKMPLGIAFRMEKLFGVPACILCEWYI